MTKMAHFIPTTTTINSEQLANLIRTNIIRLHGVPNEIISDRGPVFTSEYWNTFLGYIGTQRVLSTAYHPQTDGQTERTNAILKQYLRKFINHAQTNWSTLLDVAEFSYNNTYQSSIKTSPFNANYGFNPNFQIIPETILINGSQDAKQRIDHIHNVQEHLTSQLELAIEEMKKHADKRRQQIRDLEIGDEVYLDAQNLNTDRLNKSLNYKRLGPFKITQIIHKDVYRIELPAAWRIDNIFHVSKLTPATTNPFEGRIIPPPLPITIDKHQEYYVDEILAVRAYYGSLQYLVKWKGFGPEHNEWLKAEEVNECEALDKYLETHGELVDNTLTIIRKRKIENSIKNAKRKTIDDRDTAYTPSKRGGSVRTL
jgi:hypothetical protein